MITVWKGAVLALGMAVVGNASEVAGMKGAPRSGLPPLSFKTQKEVQQTKNSTKVSNVDDMTRIDLALKRYLGENTSSEGKLELMGSVANIGSEFREMVIVNRLIVLGGMEAVETFDGRAGRDGLWSLLLGEDQ